MYDCILVRWPHPHIYTLVAVVAGRGDTDSHQIWNNSVPHKHKMEGIQPPSLEKMKHSSSEWLDVSQFCSYKGNLHFSFDEHPGLGWGVLVWPPHLAFVGGHLCKQSLRHFGSLHFLLDFFIDSWCNIDKRLQLQGQVRGWPRRFGLQEITYTRSTVEGDPFVEVCHYQNTM